MKRSLGRRPDGKPHVFYVGKDTREALHRIGVLEKIWDTCNETWDETSMAVALQVSAGKTRILVRHPLEDQLYHLPTDAQSEARLAWLTELRARLDFLNIDIDQPDAHAAYVEHEIGKTSTKLKILKKLRQGSNQTLFAALDDYRKHLGETRIDSEDGKRTSLWGVTAMKQVTTLKKHVKDMPLSKFRLKEIEALEDTWANRVAFPDRSAAPRPRPAGQPPRSPGRRPARPYSTSPRPFADLPTSRCGRGARRTP